MPQRYWQLRAYWAESILRICYRRRTRNRAEHIRGLELLVARQRQEIRNMQRVAEERNIERRALNVLVACDGPCNAPYMADPNLVTEEVVQAARCNADRLERWWRRGGQAAHDAYLVKHNVKQ